MFAFVRRYEVEESKRGAFEAAFGPRGDWARAFALDADYRGIELFRAEDAYLVLCVWKKQESFDAFLAAHAGLIEELDCRTRALTRCSHALGQYEVLETA